MNLLDLFEEMDNAYTDFCKKATKFMDEAKLKTQPDYKSWIGKVVYVWDSSPYDKKKAILLNYVAGDDCPFFVAGSRFLNAELCEDE